jgi:CRISPR/Cas system-associated exonuclease Cas4 (RecB family)
LASRDTFEWTPVTARGTVLHKAVELGVHWQGESTPADIVDEAIARLADSTNNISDFLVAMTPGDRAQLRSYAVDLYTRFEECFPKLKRAWRPVSESSARYELFGGAIVLGTKADLTLGLADQKVIIDVKTGAIHATHREDLRFYALVESLRSGMAPRRLASYSISAARADVEDVSEGVLQAAVRRVVAGVRMIIAVELDGRDPNKRPAAHCRWCPLNNSCTEGMAFLAGDTGDDD